MMMRGKHGKLEANRLFPGILNDIFDTGAFKDENDMPRIPSVKTIVGYRKYILDLNAEKKQELINENWLSMLKSEFRQSRTVLENMKWQFLMFDAKPAFLTSDNPFFFFRHLGIGNKLSEATIPISQYIALWITWDEYAKEEFVPVSKEIVEEINLRTISARNDDIYSPVASPELENLNDFRDSYVPRRIVTELGSNAKHIVVAF